MGPTEVVEEEANDTTEGADLDEELAPDGTQLP
jgi:hypothetical protein